VTARLVALRSQRVPFAAGGPVQAVRRGERITLVGLGPDNVDTRWVDLHPDGSFDGPFALPFAVENVASDGDSLLLSGNEPGSDDAVVLAVGGDRTVIGREVVDVGPFTRWPIPVATAAGTALVFESTDGVFWSEAGGAARRLGAPGESNVLVVASDVASGRAVVVRSTMDGHLEVCDPTDSGWQRFALGGWLNTVAAAVTEEGWVVAGTVRNERAIPVAVLEGDLTTRVTASVHAPGAGPLLSSSVRVAAVGPVIIASWAERRRRRRAGETSATADAQAVTALDSEVTEAAPPGWVVLEPAGTLHHSLVTIDDLIVVVHGSDDAFVTELRVEH
jgi:hypothetical protein